MARKQLAPLCARCALALRARVQPRGGGERERGTRVSHTARGERAMRGCRAVAAAAAAAYDAIVVGGGHNGLTAAAYAARAGRRVLVLERRHVVGGAAVTEELVPGFRFSRASYLAGLLRPRVIRDLELQTRHGLTFLPRDPSSFTPTLAAGPHAGKGLLLGADRDATHASVAQFSARDADALPEYEEMLAGCRALVTPLLDAPPPEVRTTSPAGALASATSIARLISTAGWRHRASLRPLYEIVTAPAAHVLDRWFESDILKATLATDAVIGAMTSPYHAGSGYVLLHHVMGEVDGRSGVWAYVEGGMGAISDALAAAAVHHGAEIQTDAEVQSIVLDSRGRVAGVRMADGAVLEAPAVLSNASPMATFTQLLERPEEALPSSFLAHVRAADYSCGAMKINLALDALPRFTTHPHGEDAMPHHRGTIHFETHMGELDAAWRQSSAGIAPDRPVVEMTIPTALDSTLAPEGKHVVGLFVQYAPYELAWDDMNSSPGGFTARFVESVLNVVEEHAPGFRDSIVGMDVLTPRDLERIFALHRGNIFHSALSLHQLMWQRPAPGYSGHSTPVPGLYLCGAGAHPGGGVMAAAGANCAEVFLRETASAAESAGGGFGV